MFNRLRFTPARLGAIEQRELIGFDLWREQHPASQPSASTQLSGGGPRSAGRRAPPRCSRRSRGQFHRRRRRGRANRDHVRGNHKSRRWRDGDSKRDKAVTQLYRVTAWFRMRHGSRLQAASWRAVSCWPAQWRSGGGAGGQAVIGGSEPWRGLIARRRRWSTRSGQRSSRRSGGIAPIFLQVVVGVLPSSGVTSIFSRVTTVDPRRMPPSANQGFIALRNDGKWRLLNSHVLSARAPNQIGGTSGGIKDKSQ